VSSAVALARQRGAGPSSPSRLRSAFARFDELEADRVLEESLAVRSIERTVDEVLLPAVEALAAERDGDAISPEYGFAWRWASGWLAAARRVAPAAVRDDAVMLFDASATCDLDALHAQALELALRRRGLRTLTLAVGLDPSRLARALHVLQPGAVVLIGRGAPLDALARLVFAARRAGADKVAVFDFRAALPETGGSTVERLGDRALAARERLVAHLDGERPAPAAGTGDEPDERRGELRAVAS